MARQKILKTLKKAADSMAPFARAHSDGMAHSRRVEVLTDAPLSEEPLETVR